MGIFRTEVDEKVDNIGWRIKIVAECGYTHQIVGQKWVPGGALLSRRRVWPVVVVCCFLHSAYWLPTRKNYSVLYTVANPARGLLNREKRTKEKVWQHTPPPTPHTARSEKINKITRRIYRRYAGGRSRVRTRIPSARRLGLWVWLRKILYSRLR